MPDLDISLAALDRNSGERFQPLRTPLGLSTFGMNLIVLQPRQRQRIHAHREQEEVYLVLEGQLTIVIEGNEHVLGADELIRIGPAVRRQLMNAGSERLVLLALGGSGEHVGRDGLVWASWDAQEPAASPQDVPAPDDLPGD